MYKWNMSNVKYLGGYYKNIPSLSPLINFDINILNNNKENYISSGMFYNS